MLVNDAHLTLNILREIQLSTMMSMANQAGTIIQEEMAELVVNLMHFLNDDTDTVRNLVNLGGHFLILDYIEILLKENSEENTISTALSALIIAHSHSSMEVSNALR